MYSIVMCVLWLCIVVCLNSFELMLWLCVFLSIDMLNLVVCLLFLVGR